ncbi:MAG: peptide ABC transporter substrate-binding protein [Puniceicoccales bacterium]|jgi:oligopeptide transport system substrate-binding protein|nr:peptide ABC transporter substrate-binding protein [Puniceicoccales bacterium]
MSSRIKILILSLLCLVIGLGGGCVKKESTAILRVGNSIDPSSLDPQVASGVSEIKLLAALFEGLVVLHPETLEPMPGMAKSWTVSKDFRKYKFKLRKDAVWSNGDPVIAEDFVFLVKRGLSKKLASPWTDMYFFIKNARSYYDGELNDFDKVGIKAISKRRLKIKLENPVPFFLSIVSHSSWFPVNARTVLDHGHMDDRTSRWTKIGNIVTNGPFVAKSWVLSDRFVVAKNRNYWDRDMVRLKEIHFIPADADTEERMFRSGEIDITETVSISQIERYKGSDCLKVNNGLGCVFLWLNCQKAPLDNKNVRKALSFAINREALCKISNRGEKPAYSLIPHGTMDYKSKDLFQEDMDASKKLLEEAGFKNGNGFRSLTFLYNTSESIRFIAESTKETLRKSLGIDVVLENEEWKVFLDSRRSGRFDIARGGWEGDYNDATTFLNLFRSDDPNNHGRWRNPEFDKMLDKALGDAKNRSEFLEIAEGILLDEMPIIPLYFRTTAHLVNDKIGGWHGNVLDYHPWKSIFINP